MPTPLCGECYLQGYCRYLQSRVVTDAEITPAFIRSVRSHMRALKLSRDRWPLYLDEAYRDYLGLIFDGGGNEVMLDTETFDTPSIRYWFRDLCRPVPDHVTPRLRRQAKPRFIVLASILRAMFPVEALLWGKRVANDGAEPPMIGADARRRCPDHHVSKGWSG